MTTESEQCTTHHYACECRERALISVIRELNAALDAVKANATAALDRKLAREALEKTKQMIKELK